MNIINLIKEGMVGITNADQLMGEDMVPKAITGDMALISLIPIITELLQRKMDTEVIMGLCQVIMVEGTALVNLSPATIELIMIVMVTRIVMVQEMGLDARIDIMESETSFRLGTNYISLFSMHDV